MHRMMAILNEYIVCYTYRTYTYRHYCKYIMIQLYSYICRSAKEHICFLFEMQLIVFQILVPKLRAKPVRTASGVSIP